MKALVVEDTVTSATLICHLLERMGLTAVHAKDGERGLDMFREERPDLVLLDIIMPGMDGFEVARRIRQLESDGQWTPIIFLSAKASDADLERGIEVGGDDYLVKPVSEVVLKAKIRAMQRIAQMRYSLLLLTRKLNDANRELSRLSAVDGLTGIANRRIFDETLSREWRRLARRGSPMSLLLADVDHFKQFNDHYGHLAGDDCLRRVASTLQASLHRSSDMAARYGGEEFAIVLPETDAQGARCVAEGMLQAIRALDIPHQASASGSCVTISMGVATVVPVPGNEQGWSELIRMADEGLYVAKLSGRDQVCAAEGVAQVEG